MHVPLIPRVGPTANAEDFASLNLTCLDLDFCGKSSRANLQLQAVCNWLTEFSADRPYLVHNIGGGTLDSLNQFVAVQTDSGGGLSDQLLSDDPGEEGPHPALRTECLSDPVAERARPCDFHHV
jgi:hypothetical protein